MDIVLTPIEARVVGVLIEKETTTPDYYPLTLNSVVLACNQKSNREPVMELDENAVLHALNDLTRKHLVVQKNIEGSRVLKYAHDVNNVIEFTKQEIGVICVLFLRGQQTPGEINARTSRICNFESVAQVEEVLNKLISREDGPFVAILPRKPGRRERRYAHLLCGDVEVEDENVLPHENTTPAATNAESERIEKLEGQVETLQAEIVELKAKFEEFRKQFE